MKPLIVVGYFRLAVLSLFIVLLGGCSAAPPVQPTVPPAPTLASSAPTATVLFEPVVIGALTPYTHPSGVVVLFVPAGWELRDQSRPDEIAIAWLDPTRNGGLILSIFEDPNPYTDDQLGAVLSGYLTRSYGDLPGFAADPPVLHVNGVMRLAWGYTAATAGGDVPLAGASMITQQGNKIAILSLLLPATQTAEQAATSETILSGMSLNPEAPLIP